MNRSAVRKLRIDIRSGDDSALSLQLTRDGFISRQGNGNLPVDPNQATGTIDSAIFNNLVGHLDERVFPHAGVYDHPNKAGIPITYSIAFLDENDDTTAFEFRVGTETPDVGELLPYFDSFVSAAIEMTDPWFQQETAN